MSRQKDKSSIERKKLITQDLDTLFKTRFHGAVNIAGIQFQVLYSLYRGFDLYDGINAFASLQLEGIEDVDLIGIHFSDEYVQVKTSVKPWNWAKLKEPLKNFADLLGASSLGRYVLVFNFETKGDIDKLAKFKSLKKEEADRIRGKFLGICAEIGIATTSAQILLEKLEIVSMSEEHLRENLKSKMVEHFDLSGSEVVNTYYLAFMGKFLDWARDRKKILRTDIDHFRADIGENLARENEFQAYGRGLIERIIWDKDASGGDFFEGKATRPGHICLGVDVKRPLWHKKIHQAIMAAKVCVLRSSSGQGKSTLMYRYAFENWSSEQTYVLKVAKTQEQVEVICNYLRFRAKLGVPLILLIDNAGYSTQYWSSIVQECAALGIRVLITIRNEDWHRFNRHSLVGYEILEPTLDAEEAKWIFQAFKLDGRVHQSVRSSEWAYEMIGQPKLLMEYVYLLTFGRMIEERLRDQINEMHRYAEDPAKVELLRQVSLAHAFELPVVTKKVINGIHLNSDPQQVLGSLVGEYLTLEDGTMCGLHRVRSEHLVKILHENYPALDTTALKIIESIPTDKTSVFVANALCKPDMDQEAFIEGLVEKANGSNLQLVLSFLQGIFEAGEQICFEQNKLLFDEAHEMCGTPGPELLCTQTSPIDRRDLLLRMATSLGEKGENFKKLHLISLKFDEINRGIHWCQKFLVQVVRVCNIEGWTSEPSLFGKFLDWCVLCVVDLPSQIVHHLSIGRNIFDWTLDTFSTYLQGIYRYSPENYLKWVSTNKSEMISYLQYQLDCISIRIEEDRLSMVFIVDHHSEDSVNTQAVSRLRKLRSSVPFCNTYSSRGEYFLPLDLSLPVDDSIKQMPVENLPYISDIEKNAIWRRIIESNYKPDSFYVFEEGWYKLRSDIVKFVQGLSRGLQKILEGGKYDFNGVFENGKLLERIQRQLKNIPRAPQQISERTATKLERAIRSWESGVRNFFFQVNELVDKMDDRHLAHLVTINFQEALYNLPDLHREFDELFLHVPDYFEASKLNPLEIQSYPLLSNLLDTWLKNPPPTPQRDILKYIDNRKKLEWEQKLENVFQVLNPLTEMGIDIIYPTKFYVGEQLKYFVLGFSIGDPCNYFMELILVLEQLRRVKDITDYFCLVPIYQMSRFLKAGHKISTLSLNSNDFFEKWHNFVPTELPEEMLSCIPFIPFRESWRLNLVNNCHAIPLMINKIVNMKRELLLSDSSLLDRFDVARNHRNRKKINEVVVELNAHALGVKDTVTHKFNITEKRGDIKEFLNILDFIVTASVDTIETLDEVNVSQVVEIIKSID